MQTMRIALFGGSFDPIHNGHLTVAKETIVRGYADDVWFVPCASHPFAKQLSVAKIRLIMLQLATTQTIYTYEIEKHTQSYSIATLEHAAQEFPHHTFVWLMGSDQLESFKKWNNWEKILSNFGALVYPRKGYPLSPLLPGMTVMEKVSEIDVSSTKVRSLVHQQQIISSLVPSSVNTYIQKQKLYV